MLVLRDFKAERSSQGWKCFKEPHAHLKLRTTSLRERLRYIIQKAKRPKGA